MCVVQDSIGGSCRMGGAQVLPTACPSAREGPLASPLPCQCTQSVPPGSQGELAARDSLSASNGPAAFCAVRPWLLLSGGPGATTQLAEALQYQAKPQASTQTPLSCNRPRDLALVLPRSSMAQRLQLLGLALILGLTAQTAFAARSLRSADGERKLLKGQLHSSATWPSACLQPPVLSCIPGGSTSSLCAERVCVTVLVAFSLQLLMPLTP